MNNLTAIATLNILRGATVAGTNLSQSEIDRIVAKIPSNVQNFAGYCFIAGRNLGLDKLRAERNAAKRAVQEQEAALRLAEDRAQAEDEAHRTVSLLRVLDDAIAIAPPQAWSMIVGLHMLKADILNDEKSYREYCKGITLDNVYQRRRRGVVFLKPLLLASEYELLLSFVANSHIGEKSIK